jgi:hypothetical protein
MSAHPMLLAQFDAPITPRVLLVKSETPDIYERAEFIHCIIVRHLTIGVAVGAVADDTSGKALDGGFEQKGPATH